LQDANKSDRSKGAVKATEFHRSSELLLTAGEDKTLRIFQIDGDENPKLTSLHITKFPITSAKFTPDGASILMTGNSRTLATYDLSSGVVSKVPGICGRKDRKYWNLTMGLDRSDNPSMTANRLYSVASDNGHILVCDVLTNRIARSFKLNAEVTGICFHPFQNSIFATDVEAYVYEWDLGTGRCKDRFQDVGSLNISSIAVPNVGSSPSVIATGSTTGFVNLMHLGPNGIDRTPIKTFGNLTTPITTMCYHPTNEVLGIASRSVQSALRLIHVPSQSVYANWPTQRTPVGYVTSACFSRSGSHLAIGNAKGNVLLYRLNHYA